MRNHQASPKKSAAQKAKSVTHNPLASRPFAVQPKLEETARSPETKGYESVMPSFAILNPEGGRAMPVQPKLALGAPGDNYEQEADRVATQVVQRTDTHSHQLNRSNQAKAFTTGQELLAHELRPVVQQNGGAVQRLMPEMVTLGDRVSLASPLSPLSEGVIQRAKIETHALNNDPQPNVNAPNCFMAVLTWLHATFDITDAGEILNSIINKGGPSILMQKILAKAKKLKRPSEQEYQLRVTPGRIIIFAVNKSPTHAAVSTSPLQITSYNQTHWFGQAANQYSHSVLEGVRWTSKNTIQNSLGREENVYEIDVDKAAKAVGIARG